MQEYMLIYQGGDPDAHDNMSGEDFQNVMQQWEDWMGALAEKGQLVSGGNPLHYAGKRINGDHLVTDIAASEFNELVSGYSIVAANNIDEAVEIALLCPIFNYPKITVEVREIMQLEGEQ